MINKYFTPNLPDKQGSIAIVSCDITEEIRKNLISQGIKSITIRGNKCVEEAVRNHPDIYINHYSDSELLVENNCSINGGVKKISISMFAENKCSEYPFNCGLNCVRLGRYLIGNTKYICPELLEFVKRDRLECINVKQGYTKCNICVVDENSIITEDAGIAKKCMKYGINVLKLNCNAVRIKNYNYGFIGGASGKISKDTLAFFGNIKLHPEFESIEEFCNARNVRCLSLSQEELYDYGSLITIF